MANLYDDLDIRPVINAAATFTKLGGSIMPKPVREAMNAAGNSFIDLFELQEKVGKRLAKLTRNEAAYVSSGAAAGITLCTIAALAGTDRETALKLPDVRGLAKNEVIVFKAQRNSYDFAISQTGARVIEAESSLDDLRRKLNDKTAAIFWFAGEHFAIPGVDIADVIVAAKERGAPVFVDAAAQIPFVANFWRFTSELGADAVIFSGGKGLRGPQSSGLVLGKQWVIDACRAQGAPNHGIARPMKVGKEELAGILAAVEWTLEQDEAEVISGYEQMVANWIEDLAGIPGVRVDRSFPSEAGQPYPRAFVHISEPSPWTPPAVVDALWEGTPRISVVTIPSQPGVVALNPQTLEPGEDEIVTRRVKEVLTSRPA
jgi:L-seryl-tRNA(Ser) seleniumtransferase